MILRSYSWDKAAEKTLEGYELALKKATRTKEEVLTSPTELPQSTITLS
jgi:hypothetical protein